MLEQVGAQLVLEVPTGVEDEHPRQRAGDDEHRAHDGDRDGVPAERIVGLEGVHPVADLLRDRHRQEVGGGEKGKAPGVAQPVRPRVASQQCPQVAPPALVRGGRRGPRSIGQNSLLRGQARHG